MSARLVRYRVDVSVQGLKYGEIVEIDPTDPGWGPLISLGYLREAPPELQIDVLDDDWSGFEVDDARALAERRAERQLDDRAEAALASLHDDARS